VAISIVTDPKTRQPKIRLVLPDDIHDGPVSVVGTFNDWTPGRHRLVRRANGTRSVTVPVTAGQELRFRYLGSGGHWFDDPDARQVESDGSVVSVLQV
jgi:1,4-alpha-glucan branching enzyme